MKIGDMPPPLPGRVSNPRIRDDQALNAFLFELGQDAPCYIWWCYTQALFDYSLSSIFPQSLREKVKTLSFSTYQLFNAASSSTIWLLSIGRVKSGSQKTWISLSPRVKQLISLSCHYTKNSGKHRCSFYLDFRGGQFADRQGSSLKTVAWWDAIQPEALTCQSMQKLSPQDMLAFGNQSEKQMSLPMQRFLRWKFVRNQMEDSQTCASKQLIRFSLTLELLQ